MRALFLVAGHGLSESGGMDNGAVANGTTERQEAVEICQDLYTRLAADPAFSSIQLLKIGVGNRLSLRDKIDQVNSKCGQNGWTSNDTILLSVHINASSTPDSRGLEAWYGRYEGTEEYAIALVDAVHRTTGLPKRAAPIRPSDQNRYGRLGIIDDTIPKAVLVECGFLTNIDDANFLKNSQVDDAIAWGLHEGLKAHLNITSGPAAPQNFYSDVPAEAWYHDDIKLCLEQGIFTMPGDHLFHPDRPLSRAEAAAIFARHLRNGHL